MAEALYTKYRPQIFEDVVGQEHIERTIKNAIEQDKVSHAYLFCGPRGTGKTTTARLLAKALLCSGGPTAEPDGTCEDCKLIAQGEHPDVYELDAASRTGVDNVREEIIGRVQFAPTRGRYKVYIIDEVHMLSTAAFNALLKTLEEPPSHVVFILATTDPQKVPETIHSRCQRFDFRRISAEAMVARLGAVCVAEGVEFEGEALDLIAHRAEGGLRNALTSLEQIIAFGEGKVTLAGAESMLGSLDSGEMSQVMRAVGTRDVAECFRWTAQYVETGADLARFTRDMAERVRNMYVMSLSGADVALEVSEAERRELAEELPLFGPDRLARLLGVLGDLSAELKTSTNPRLSFEIALTRMVRPDSDLTLASLAERIEALESGYAATAHVLGAPGAGAQVGGQGLAGDAAARPQGQAQSPMQPRAQEQPRIQEQPQFQAEGQVPQVRQPQAEQQASGQQPQGRQERPQTEAQPQPRMQQARQARPQADFAQPASAQAASREARPESPEAREASAQAMQAQADAGAGAAAGTGTSRAGQVPAELAASLENPAALQRIWHAALTSLKKAKAAYGVLFLNTKATFDQVRGMLVIEFPAENAFAFKAVQKPDVQDAVSAALVQACGVALPFALAQSGGGAAMQPVAARPAAADAGRGAQPNPAAQARSRMQAQPQAQAQARSQAQPRARAQQPSGPSSQRPAAQEPAARPVAAASSAVPDYDEVPLDAYGAPPASYDDVPYSDADAASFEQAASPAAFQAEQPRRSGNDAAFAQGSPRAASAGLASAPAQSPSGAVSAGSAAAPAQSAAEEPRFRVPDRTSAAPAEPGLPPEPDARTSASLDVVGPNGEPAVGGFDSPDDLAAILAAGGFQGARVQEL